MAISGSRGPLKGRFRPASRPSVRLQTHSSPQLLQQRASHHPQLGQRKQRVQLRRVLGQSSAAHLHMPELGLDHPDRVFDLGPDARLGPLQRVLDRAHRRVLVQHIALARSHRHMPVDFDVLGLFRMRRPNHLALE
jgi:hypothetical protein